MTVAELVDALRGMPPDSTVEVDHDGSGRTAVRDVYLDPDGEDVVWLDLKGDD